MFIEKIKKYKIVLFVGNGSINQYNKDELYIDKKIKITDNIICVTIL